MHFVPPIATLVPNVKVKVHYFELILTGDTDISYGILKNSSKYFGKQKTCFWYILYANYGPEWGI